MILYKDKILEWCPKTIMQDTLEDKDGNRIAEVSFMDGEKYNLKYTEVTGRVEMNESTMLSMTRKIYNGHSGYEYAITEMKTWCEKTLLETL